MWKYDYCCATIDNVIDELMTIILHSTDSFVCLRE